MNISPEQYAEQNPYLPDDLEGCPSHPNSQVRRLLDCRIWRGCGVPWMKELTGVSFECPECGRKLVRKSGLPAWTPNHSVTSP